MQQAGYSAPVANNVGDFVGAETGSGVIFGFNPVGLVVGGTGVCLYHYVSERNRWPGSATWERDQISKAYEDFKAGNYPAFPLDTSVQQDPGFWYNFRNTWSVRFTKISEALNPPTPPRPSYIPVKGRMGGVRCY